MLCILPWQQQDKLVLIPVLKLRYVVFKLVSVIGLSLFVIVVYLFISFFGFAFFLKIIIFFCLPERMVVCFFVCLTIVILLCSCLLLPLEYKFGAKEVSFTSLNCSKDI